MTCLLHTKENDHLVEELAKTLSTEGGKFDETIYEENKRIAYHMLCCNNGYAMKLNPDGKDSDLWKYLYENVCHRDEKATILMKSYIYTKEYAAKHGDWLSKNEKEPTYLDIQPDVERNEMKKLFPNTDIDEVEQYLYDTLSDSIIENSGIYEVNSIFAEERNRYVQNKMDLLETKDEIEAKVRSIIEQEQDADLDNIRSQVESGYIMRFRSEYNKNTIRTLVHNVKQKLVDAWGIKFDQDGKAINNLKESDFKELKWYGKFNSGLDPYWILRYRCTIIDSLLDRVENPEQTEIVLKIVQSAIRGDSVLDINTRMINAYLDLFKDSPIVVQGIIHSGRLVERKGDPKKEDVERALADFKKQLGTEMADYSESSVKSPIMRAYKKIMSGIKDIILATFMFVSNLDQAMHHIPSIVGSAALGATIGNPYVFVGAMIAAPIASEITNKILIDLYGSSFNSYRKYHEALRNIILAHAMLLDMTAALEDETRQSKLLQELLSDSRGDTIQITLYNLRYNINELIESLKSTAEYGVDKANQLHKLKELFDLCNAAIKSDYQNRKKDISYFLTDYCKTADTTIAAVNVKLSRWLEHIEEVDVHELMRFKTDVIGAYYKTINCGLLPAIRKRQDLLFFGEPLIQVIERRTVVNINNVKKLFGEVLKKYIDKYIDDVLEETAEKTVGKRKSDVLKRNIKHWMNNEINCGNISVLSKYISPARTNTSPLVRMITQKLEEVEQNVVSEVEEVAADLEAVRVKNRSVVDRFDLRNTLNKFCERDKDGMFTGNLKSAVNYGQYMSDLYKERKFLIEKHSLPVNKDGDVIWDDVDEQQWKDYHVDLILWMAGADRDKNGNYAPVDENGKYKKDKNGNIILHGSKIDNGLVDLKHVPFEPRVHRRYTYQYYIDKTEILGRDGCNALANLNLQIAEINEKCMTEVEVDGKKVRVPIPAKLTKDLRDRLASATMRKALLSSTYRVEDDDMDHKYITAVKIKSGEELEMSKRFFMWKQKQRDYWEAPKTTKNATYDAIRKDYKNKIEELSLKIKDGQTSLIEEKTKLEAEYKLFIADSTKYQFTDEFMNLFGELRTIKYDLSDPKVQEYFSIRAAFAMITKKIASANAKRTPDLSRIGNPESKSDEADSVKSVWKELTKLDERLRELKHQLNIVDQEDITEEGKLKKSDYISYVLIPKLDGEEELNYTFAKWLLHNTDVTKDDIQYLYSDSEVRYCRLLKRPEADESKVLGLKVVEEHDGKRVIKQKYNSIQEIYATLPTGIFSNVKSILSDEEYDNSDPNYILVNKNYKRYDNLKEYDKIKNDPLYNKILSVLDATAANYAGFTRLNRYMLPQREASHTDMFGRGFLQFGHSFMSTTGKEIVKSLKDIYTFNTRDEYIENSITRADGTTVEFIPVRWMSRLKDSNRIDSDIISSVIDAYTESVRYKYRSRIAPIMEAMYFSLCGGYDTTPDATTRHLADVVRGEINKTVYGRTLTGTGEGGRLRPDEVRYAKASQTFRQVLHGRLMKHNWRSVIKNGLDSFFNLLLQAFVGKYILTRNVINALGRLIFDKNNNNFVLYTQLFGIRRSKATNMTQALMHLNNVGNTIHERYKGQNKWWIRRFLNMVPTIEFEGIDYTAKAIITEAVYDAFRLIKNPSTGQYQFVNENEAELMFMADGYDRIKGYDAWKNSKTTLRDVYKFNKKLGIAELKDTIKIDGLTISVLDLVRPSSSVSISDDNRARVLETKIKTSIRQIASVVNGMLDAADRNTLARSYSGSIILAFRGWMVSLSGEYYKTGTDFYDYERDIDTGVGLERKSLDIINSLTNDTLRLPAIDDNEYKGQYNFATGTIDDGLHRNLFKTLFSHFVSFVKMALIFPEYLTGNNHGRAKRYKNMTANEMYQLRNFAFAVDAFALVVFLTTLALSWYSGDDGDDEYKKGMKSLVYSSLLASISERFTQLGGAPFLLSTSDIIKAVSVGTVLMDDAHFLIDAAQDLLNLLYSKFSNDTISDDIDMENWNTKLLNGSFQGKTKAQRNITRAAAMLLPALGVDALPYLFVLDEIAPQHNEEGGLDSWTDYDLNYFKSKTEKGNLAAAKFYGTIVPTGTLSKVINSTFPEYPLTIQKKKNSSEKEIKAPTKSKYNNNYSQNYSQKYSKKY